MLNGDSWDGFFYLTLTLMIDSYILFILGAGDCWLVDIQISDEWIKPAELLQRLLPVQG